MTQVDATDVTTDLDGTTAVITGASRGFGGAIAAGLVGRGAEVVGVARTPGPLEEQADRLGSRFTSVVGDAADGALAQELLARHQPRLVVLVAGAVPEMRPLQDQTWETFSRNWESDVRIAFEWIAASLRQPLPSGSHVISFSSGAALRGSPLSGGYAGANAMIRFTSAYAQQESDRLGLGIRFTSVLPQLSPATAVGGAGVAAYAERSGIDVDAFVARMPHVLTPELVSDAIARLDHMASADDELAPAYRILETGEVEPLP